MARESRGSLRYLTRLATGPAGTVARRQHPNASVFQGNNLLPKPISPNSAPMKMRPGSDRFPCPLVLLLACLAILGLARARALADTTLEARLVPAINITGPLHSLQQVQYSTNLADTNAWMILSHVRLDTTPKPFYDATASGGKRFYRTKTVGVWDTNLVWIPPGAFLMGSPTNEQGRA